MKDTLSVLAVLDRRIQALQQSRPEFGRELEDTVEASATIAELMAVVQAFLDLPLQPEELEERAISALERARGSPHNDDGSNSLFWAASRTRRFSSATSKGTFAMSHHLTHAVQDCIAACNECASECGNCFSHMVGMESSNDCPASCIECAAICHLCADAMARNSPFSKEICALCAKICDWCAEQCAAHKGEHCQRCAEACRRCAESCRRMAT